MHTHTHTRRDNHRTIGRLEEELKHSLEERKREMERMLIKSASDNANWKRAHDIIVHRMKKLHEDVLQQVCMHLYVCVCICIHIRAQDIIVQRMKKLPEDVLQQVCMLLFVCVYVYIYIYIYRQTYVGIRDLSWSNKGIFVGHNNTTYISYIHPYIHTYICRYQKCLVISQKHLCWS
jgi:hypothetical protein